MMENDTRTRILYNGRNPLSRNEIGRYARYAAKLGLPLWFDDLHKTDLDAWGVNWEQAASVLHVRHEGQIFAGLDAYMILWNIMPKYRWIPGLVDRPYMRPVTRRFYDLFVASACYRCPSTRAKAKAMMRQAAMDNSKP